jgi:hypothetical protein
LRKRRSAAAAGLLDRRTLALQQWHLVPTKKGLAMAARRLPELANAITKALEKARELGLIDDEASE